MARPKASVEQRQQQRERIRNAASQIYQQRGLAAVSVRAISEAAGVSTGTLYSYFANLEELMQSLWIEPVAELNRQLEATISADDDPLDRIEALLDAYRRFAEDQPDVFRGAILFVRPRSLEAPGIEPADGLPFFRLLRAAVTDGQASGQVRPGDSELMAQTLWAGIHGALALPVNIDRFDIKPQVVLAPAMIEMLLASIKVGTD